MRRIETRPSRTAEWTCICRAASTLETNQCYRSGDAIAIKILPQPIRTLIRIRPYRVLHCRFGAPRGIYEYVIARTKYFDALYERALRDEFDQIFILGAGFDTRAVRFRGAAPLPAVYELDAPSTQKRKLELFRLNGIEPPSNVTYAAMDFEEESLAHCLNALGARKNKRSLFMMEGVSMYLTPESMDAAFRTIADFMSAASLLGFDYVYSDALRRRQRRPGAAALVRSTSRVKEPLRFGLEEGEAAAFLERYGLHVVDHQSPEELDRSYFTRDRGKVSAHVNKAHCLVTAAK